MNKNNIKIYCKFNKAKPSVDKVICKMFLDFAQKKVNKNIEKGSGKILLSHYSHSK